MKFNAIVLVAAGFFSLMGGFCLAQDANRLKAKLADLDSLRADKVLSEEEYQSARSRVISQFSQITPAAPPARVPAAPTPMTAPEVALPALAPQNPRAAAAATPPPAPPAPKGAPGSITIEALIDGPSSLHLTRNGIFWEQGSGAKPGRHYGNHEATYVNGVAWQPVWQKSDNERGSDTSDVFAVSGPVAFSSISKATVSVELLALSKVRGENGFEDRTPIELESSVGEVVIRIPDRETGSRWYKFIIDRPTRSAAPMGGGTLLDKGAYDQKKGVTRTYRRFYYVH